MSVNSTLNTAAQTSLPAWVRARGLGVYLLVFQGAMAVGSVIWGAIADRIGLRTTLLIAGVAMLAGAAATLRLRLTGLRELDTRPSLHWPEPTLIVERPPDHGPVLVTVEYLIEPVHGAEFAHAPCKPCGGSAGEMGRSVGDCSKTPPRRGNYLETFVVESWAEHLRQHERMTVSDRELEAKAFAFHQGRRAASSDALDRGA